MTSSVSALFWLALEPMTLWAQALTVPDQLVQWGVLGAAGSALALFLKRFHERAVETAESLTELIGAFYGPIDQRDGKRRNGALDTIDRIEREVLEAKASAALSVSAVHAMQVQVRKLLDKAHPEHD